MGRRMTPGPADDYDFGAALVHATTNHETARFLIASDPATVEQIGSAMRPAIEDLTTALGHLLDAFTRLGRAGTLAAARRVLNREVDGWADE